MAVDTYANALTQLNANLAYETDATGAMARALLQAIRYMLFNRPSLSSQGGGVATQFDLATLQAQENRVSAWLATRGLAGGTANATPATIILGAGSDFRG